MVQERVSELLILDQLNGLNKIVIAKMFDISKNRLALMFYIMPLYSQFGTKTLSNAALPEINVILSYSSFDMWKMNI